MGKDLDVLHGYSVSHMDGLSYGLQAAEETGLCARRFNFGYDRGIFFQVELALDQSIISFFDLLELLFPLESLRDHHHLLDHRPAAPKVRVI